nr:hypothetical protein [Tanacetum cinerariifolium]
MGIHDFLCLFEWNGSEVQEEVIMILGLLFRGFPSTAPHAAADVAIPDHTPEDLVASTPNAKVMAKDEASKKRKASTSGSDPSHVAKHTSRSQAFTSPTSASQDSSSDATDKDFFPFAPSPYYATYPEDGVVAGSYEGLLKSHGKYVQSVDSQLRSLQQKLTAYQGLVSQVSGLQKQVTDLNNKVTAFDAAFVKAKTKGKDQKKKIKSLSWSLDHVTAEVARLSSDMNQAINMEAKKDVEILRLRASPPEVKGRLIEATPLVATTGYRFLNKATRVSPPLPRESTVTLVAQSSKLPCNVVPSSSIVVVVKQPSAEQNE